MEFINGHLTIGILLLFSLVHSAHGIYGHSSVFPKIYGLNVVDRTAPPLSPSFAIDILNRSSFPPGFIFGAASAAYQIEGAWNIDGKGPSIWDTFTHKFPEKIADRSNGDVAADSYHRYKEDIQLLKEMNADSYRFSISWSRILPYGKVSKGINQKGVDYYKNLIDEILANDLEPSVTIFHWDVPQALEDEYGGFLSRNIIEDFRDYANLLFELYGDHVKYWITFNEPWSFSISGYDSGGFAPGRCSSWMENNCTGGDSGTEPYIVSHHQLLAHAEVVELYRTKYQPRQNGKIGITLVSTWMVPFTNSSLDKRAAARALDFMLGWFMSPLVYGHYPITMRALVRNRLPTFTASETKKLIGSYDFLGLNYYTAYYAAHQTTPFNKVNLSCSTDQRVSLAWERNGTLIGQPAGSAWLHVYPSGIQELLLYIKRKYNNPIIYITENGIDELNDPNLSLPQALQDSFRINYYYRHLAFVKEAIDEGVQVKGYYGWAIIDNMEWANGYTVRFGMNYVDFKTLQRYRKLSAHWFERFLKK